MNVGFPPPSPVPPLEPRVAALEAAKADQTDRIAMMEQSLDRRITQVQGNLDELRRALAEWAKTVVTR